MRANAIKTIDVSVGAIFGFTIANFNVFLMVLDVRETFEIQLTSEEPTEMTANRIHYPSDYWREL